MIHQQFILTSTSPSQRELKLIMHYPKCLGTTDTVQIHILFNKLVFFYLLISLLGKLYLYYKRFCFTPRTNSSYNSQEDILSNITTNTWLKGYLFQKFLTERESWLQLKTEYQKKMKEAGSSEKQMEQFSFLKILINFDFLFNTSRILRYSSISLWLHLKDSVFVVLFNKVICAN